MRILITGGAGFIGSHIAELFQGKADIRILDNFKSGYRHNLDGLQVEVIEGSVTDPAIVAQAVQGIDYVFHLAAMVSVPESMHNIQGCVDVNVKGMLTVLRASADAGVKKLCFSSSAAVYGQNPELPKLESMVPEPMSPYAVTKLDGEYYCRMFQEEGWLNTVSLRYFNVFGPKQDPTSAYAAVVPIFIGKARRNESMTIYGDGEQTRDFVYVKDVAAANAYFCTESQESGVFNIGYGHSVTINQLARQIIQLLNSSSEIQYAPVRAGDVMHSCASVDKATLAGFKVYGSLDQGLKELCK